MFNLIQKKKFFFYIKCDFSIELKINSILL